MNKPNLDLKIPKPKGNVNGFEGLAAWEKEVAARAAGPIKKTNWWIRVPKKWWLEDLEKLSPAERCVLITLKIHDNKRYGCFPSTRTMARELHVCQRTILKAVKKLKKKGFVKITKTAGRFNSYELNGEA